MVLGDLDEGAHAGNIDDHRGVARDINGSSVKEPQKGIGDKENGERVDLIKIGPSLKGLILEQCHSKCFCVLVLGCRKVIEECGCGADLPGAKIQIGSVLQSL